MLSSVSIVTQRMGMLSPLNNPNFLLLHLLLGAGEVRRGQCFPQEPHRTLALCAVQGPASRSPQGPSPPPPPNLPLQHSIIVVPGPGPGSCLSQGTLPPPAAIISSCGGLSFVFQAPICLNFCWLQFFNVCFLLSLHFIATLYLHNFDIKL